MKQSKMRPGQLSTEVNPIRDIDLSIWTPAVKLYSTKAAAAHLGMGEAALKYHVYQGNVKPQKVGHSLVFTQAQLDEFQSNRRPRGRPRSERKGKAT